MPRVRKPRKKQENQDNVVKLDTKKKATKRKPKKTDDFYKKYPWVKAGSVREVEKGTVVDGVKSKGRMCTVVCQECKSERTVNTQDAFQVKMCATCRKKARSAKRKKTG